MQQLITQLGYFVNILVAALCGVVIGFERKTRYKEAGVRTHALVCSGSALIMVISLHAFGQTGADRARVAAQIVTGIGFLGAGIIVYRKQVLRGLTTAAGVWMTSGIGMAAGAGMFYLAALSSVLIILIHIILSLPIAIFRTKRFFGIKVEFSCAQKEHTEIKKIFGAQRFSNIEYKKTESGYFAEAEIYTQDYTDDEKLLDIIKENPSIKSIRRIVE